VSIPLAMGAVRRQRGSFARRHTTYPFCILFLFQRELTSLPTRPTHTTQPTVLDHTPHTLPLHTTLPSPPPPPTPSAHYCYLARTHTRTPACLAFSSNVRSHHAQPVCSLYSRTEHPQRQQCISRQVYSLPRQCTGGRSCVGWRDKI